MAGLPHVQPIEKCIFQLEDKRWCYGEAQRRTHPYEPDYIVRVYPHQLPPDIRLKIHKEHMTMSGEYPEYVIIGLPKERVIVIAGEQRA